MADQTRLSFFADVPDFTGYVFPDAPPDDGVEVEHGPPTSRVQVAKTGKFKHPRYGTFTITAATFDRMVANFNAGIPTAELPVDFDHEPDYGGKSEACGWIKRLDHDGSAMYATVEWLWAGAYAIREGTYKYVSPTWSLAYIDEAGEKLGPTLLAFGLTNRPYFSLPSVSLSASFSRDDMAVCEEVASDSDGAADSRGRMSDLATFAKALNLAEDTAEDKILASLAELIEKAKTAPAEDEKVIKASRLTDLEGAEAKLTDSDKENVKLASRLDAIEAERADERFDAAFTSAMDDGKVGAAQRDQLKALFDKDHDGTLAFIADMPKVVPTAARGERGEVDDGEAPDGVDADSYALNRKVETYMREHPDVDYSKALDLVRSQEAAR